jgi:hypothetical protein
MVKSKKLKKNVMFLVSSQQRLGAIVDLARCIVKSSNVSLCFTTSQKDNICESLKYEGVQIINLRGTAVSEERKLRSKRSIKKILIPLILKLSIGQIYWQKRTYKKLYRDFKIAKKVLLENSIDFLFLPGDRDLVFVQAFLKAAKELGIKIIIPYLTYSGKEGPLKLREKKKEYQNLLFSSVYSKIAFKCFSRQVFKNTMFYSPAVTKALDNFGTLSANPWINGAGLSDIVCVDSEHTKQRYISEGVPAEKLKIVGDGSFRNLSRAFKNKDEIKKEVLNKYSLDTKLKNVIISLPQLGEHDLLPWEDHWKEINYLVGAVKKLNANILLSLHPRMKREEYVFLECKYGVTILEERLEHVLPMADAFVATFSSTVVWSVLCGVRSIVVDFYGLNYEMFDFLKSIKFFNKKDEFSDFVSGPDGLTYSVDFSKDWSSLSRDLTFNDGVSQRYLDLL